MDPLRSDRDINELLTTGYFKTARGRSPGTNEQRPIRSHSSHTYTEPRSQPQRQHQEQSSSFLLPHHNHPPREPSRSRSRAPIQKFRTPPPPRPTVEEEAISLAKEQFFGSSSQSQGQSQLWGEEDPPLRGIIEQNPIILEAGVSEAEAARLHGILDGDGKGKGDGNGKGKGKGGGHQETRFVVVPREDVGSEDEAGDVERRRLKRRSEGRGVGGVGNGDVPPLREIPGLEGRRGEDFGKKRDGVRKDGVPLDRRTGQEIPIRERKEVIPPKEIPPMERRRQDLPVRERKEDTPREIPSMERRRQELPRERREATPPREMPPVERRRHDIPRERRETTPPKENPPLERRKSRHDLPSLETKTPKEIPPHFRRSASAYGAVPQVETLKATSRTPAAEIFLSPDVMRGKDHFPPSQSAPRYNTGDFGGRATPQNEKRNSGSLSNSRPGTPSSEKRYSGTSDSGRRSRRNSVEKLEKMTRPQQLSEEFGGGRSDRRPPLPERKSTAQSSRSSKKYYSSTDDDITDSDSDRRRRKHRSNNLHPADSGHIRSSSRSNTTPRPVKPSSRFSSPLPSPKVSPSQFPMADNFGRSGTFPVMRKPVSRPVSPNGHQDQKLNPFEFPPNPRPTSRHSSQASLPIPIPIPMPVYPMESVGPLPIPIPTRVDLHSPGDSRRNPNIPQHDDDRSSTVRPAEKPIWQPPKFQPPSHLEKPVGSYRRYSEDIERGSVAPLPTCPRKNYVRGRNDWLTLPQCPGFDICPSCYDSTMAPTEFRHMFIPAPFRSPDIEVLCDFGSSPWYRIAWLLTLKERRRDLDIFYGLAKASKSTTPCSGSHQAMRQWYSILDPKTNSPIRNFDVCYSCVKSIEVLLPPLRGIFVPTDVHTTSSLPRICDLRFDSKRFVKYFDALETTADDTDPYNPPDTRSLASIVRRFAILEECQKDIDLRDARWHLITQLPEFTVCPECFEEVVRPGVLDRKAIPSMFYRDVKRIGRASCQLYSERMREVFQECVERDDWRGLVQAVRGRRQREEGFKRTVGELRNVLGGMNVGDYRRLEVEGEIERAVEGWRAWE